MKTFEDAVCWLTKKLQEVEYIKDYEYQHNGCSDRYCELDTEYRMVRGLVDGLQSYGKTRQETIA